MPTRLATWILAKLGFDPSEHAARTQQRDAQIANGERAVASQREMLAEQGLVNDDVRRIRETGIWIQDLTRGAYRPRNRNPRRGHP